MWDKKIISTLFFGIVISVSAGAAQYRCPRLLDKIERLKALELVFNSVPENQQIVVSVRVLKEEDAARIASEIQSLAQPDMIVRFDIGQTPSRSMSARNTMSAVRLQTTLLIRGDVESVRLALQHGEVYEPRFENSYPTPLASRFNKATERRLQDLAAGQPAYVEIYQTLLNQEEFTRNLETLKAHGLAFTGYHYDELRKWGYVRATGSKAQVLKAAQEPFVHSVRWATQGDQVLDIYDPELNELSNPGPKYPNLNWIRTSFSPEQAEAARLRRLERESEPNPFAPAATHGQEENGSGEAERPELEKSPFADFANGVVEIIKRQNFHLKSDQFDIRDPHFWKNMILGTTSAIRIYQPGVQLSRIEGYFNAEAERAFVLGFDQFPGNLRTEMKDLWVRIKANLISGSEHGGISQWIEIDQAVEKAPIWQFARAAAALAYKQPYASVLAQREGLKTPQYWVEQMSLGGLDRSISFGKAAYYLNPAEQVSLLRQLLASKRAPLFEGREEDAVRAIAQVALQKVEAPAEAK